MTEMGMLFWKTKVILWVFELGMIAFLMLIHLTHLLL